MRGICIVFIAAVAGCGDSHSTAIKCGMGTSGTLTTGGQRAGRAHAALDRGRVRITAAGDGGDEDDADPPHVRAAYT
jgi:hypothetical protein